SKNQNIGEGKHGTVFRGTDRETGRTVAIKSFKVSHRCDIPWTCDLVREIRALRELQLPNIIQLFDIYPEKSSIHLVMEFLPADVEQII
ncbi:kinase-like protein, partial [Gonapodya prolifera JEL478]